MLILTGVPGRDQFRAVEKMESPESIHVWVKFIWPEMNTPKVSHHSLEIVSIEEQPKMA